MAGDLYIRVCETREQKSVRRHEARFRGVSAVWSNDDKGRPISERLEAKIHGRWYDYDFWQDRFPDVEADAFRTIVERNRFSRHRYAGPFEWLGELSRMSVVLGTGTVDDAIPQALQAVGGIFGEHVFVKVTDSLVTQVSEAFAGAQKHLRYKQARVDEVVAFLRKHRGKSVFLD